MPNSLSVMHCLLTLDPGGLERFVLQLATEQRWQGWSAALLTVDQPGELAGQAYAAGFPFYSLMANPAHRLASQPELAKLLQELQPSVLHSHQIAVTLLLGPVAAKLGIPLVHTEHGNAFARARSWREWLKLWWVYRRALRHCQRVFCVSEEIRRTLARYRLGDSASRLVMPNGIPDLPPKARDIRAELGWGPEEFVIGSVGRLNEVKRYDLLIEAFSKLTSHYQNVRLLLVGDGPERGRLVGLVAAAGLEERVHFAGYQSEPQDYLRAMSVFVLTSRSEGFPLSVLEAWAAEKPVLATAVGGLPHIIHHGIDGLLVPSGDSGSMVEGLQKLHDDPGLLGRLAQAGRAEFLQRYQLAMVTRQYLEQYSEVLPQRK